MIEGNCVMNVGVWDKYCEQLCEREGDREKEKYM